MKVVLLLSLMMALGCSHQKTKSGLADAQIDLDVEEIKLSNGLKILLVENPKLPIFSLYMFYKVGGKNERPGITGASHFLEHMMFKGAKKYGPGIIDFTIEGSGGSTNAYTTNDQTVYYENLPSTQLDIMLNIEADRMENLLLKPDDFEKERAVVLEERKMRYENSPRGQLFMQMMSEVFKGTPYGTSVIGNIPDLKSVSREQIFTYFKKFYAPNNVTMVIVGDIDISKTKKMIEAKFGKIPSSPSVEDEHKSLTAEMFKSELTKSRNIFLHGASPNPMFMIAYPSYPVGHPKSYALDILGSVIGDGDSSFLKKRFTFVNKPMASSIYAGNYTLEKSGVFFLGGELMKGVKPEEFKTTVQKDLAIACESEINERAISKVKNNYLIDVYKGLDTNAGLAAFLGERDAFYGDYRAYKKELEIYSSLGVEDVKAVCHELVKEPSLFITVWDKNKK